MSNHYDEQFFCLLDDTANYYQYKLTAATCDIYRQALSNYSIEQLSQAISEHISSASNGRFMPKVSDLLTLLPQKATAPMLEEKSTLSWCDDTQRLLEKYCPNNRRQTVGLKKL